MFSSGISLKRSVAAAVLPYREFLDRTNWTSRWCRTVRQADCPKFPRREQMYEYLHSAVLDNEPIDYLEFGVADGASLRNWCALNRHAGSRFFGFDCFAGLPEDWHADHPKSMFNRDGQPPDVPDPRVQFQVIFDEFWDSLHEYRALTDYSAAYRRPFKIVAAADRFSQVAVMFSARQP